MTRVYRHTAPPIASGRSSYEIFTADRKTRIGKIWHAADGWRCIHVMSTNPLSSGPFRRYRDALKKLLDDHRNSH